MELSEKSPEVIYIDEPELSFGHGQTSDHPKDGLFLYGPHNARVIACWRQVPAAMMCGHEQKTNRKGTGCERTSTAVNDVVRCGTVLVVPALRSKWYSLPE